MHEDEGLESPARLKVVRETGLLDSSEDHEFDQLTRLASRLLRVPTALVTIVAKDRQYVKSNSGQGENTPNPAGSSQTLDMSFCRHAVASREPLIVEDAREHPLVQDSGAIAAGVLAYAGIPLEVDGEAIGALCVIDSRPRVWSPNDLDTLRALARSAMRLVEERIRLHGLSGDVAREGIRLEKALSEHLRSLAAYEELLTSPSIDLEAEKDAREAVEGSFAVMASAAHRSGDTDPDLFETIGKYIGLEHRRRQATERFAAGNMSLSELEGCILAQDDALARLRVLAAKRA